MINVTSEDPSSGRYRYRLTGLTRMDLKRDMTLLWVKLLNRITFHREHGTWSRIIFEVWVEHGYVLAYPQKRGESHNQRPLEVLVDIDYFETVLRQSTTLSDAEQINGLLTMAYLNTRSSIADAYLKEDALSEMKAIMQNNDFKCFTMQGNDEKSIAEIQIFFR